MKKPTLSELIAMGIPLEEAKKCLAAADEAYITEKKLRTQDEYKEIKALLNHALVDLDRNDVYSAASDVALAVKEFLKMGVKIPR